MYQGVIYRHYRITEDGFEKSYIGKHEGLNPEKNRWGSNGRYYKPKNKSKTVYFWNAIQKYGWDSFTHEILLVIQCETIEELRFWIKEFECYYIWYYDSYYKNGNGYNMTLGGEGTSGFKHTDEMRKRNSEAQKRIASEPDYINPFKDKKHTSKTRELMSKNHANFLGDKHPRAKKVMCINNGMIFNTIKDAKEWIGKGDIKACLNGRTKSAGRDPDTGEKLTWKYVEF